MVLVSIKATSHEVTLTIMCLIMSKASKPNLQALKYYTSQDDSLRLGIGSAEVYCDYLVHHLQILKSNLTI